MNFKKIGKVLTSKSVGSGPSSYFKKNLPGRGLTKVEKHRYRRPAIGGTSRDTRRRPRHHKWDTTL